MFYHIRSNVVKLHDLRDFDDVLVLNLAGEALAMDVFVAAVAAVAGFRYNERLYYRYHRDRAMVVGWPNRLFVQMPNLENRIRL